MKLQIRFKNKQVVPIKWNIWRFSYVMLSHLVRYFVLHIHFKLQNAKIFYRIPPGKTFTTRVKIHEGSSSTEFLYFKFVYSFRIKMKQKFVFIVSSACKQRPSIIWGKELEVFLFIFMRSFICHFMTCINVSLGAFKDNWHGF